MTAAVEYNRHQSPVEVMEEAAGAAAEVAAQRTTTTTDPKSPGSSSCTTESGGGGATCHNHHRHDENPTLVPTTPPPKEESTTTTSMHRHPESYNEMMAVPPPKEESAEDHGESQQYDDDQKALRSYTNGEAAAAVQQLVHPQDQYKKSFKLCLRTSFWGRKVYGRYQKKDPFAYQAYRVLSSQVVLHHDKAAWGCCPHAGRRVLELQECHFTDAAPDQDWNLYYVQSQGSTAWAVHHFFLLPQHQTVIDESLKMLHDGWTLMGTVSGLNVVSGLDELLRPTLEENDTKYDGYQFHHVHLDIMMNEAYDRETPRSRKMNNNNSNFRSDREAADLQDESEHKHEDQQDDSTSNGSSRHSNKLPYQQYHQPQGPHHHQQQQQITTPPRTQTPFVPKSPAVGSIPQIQHCQSLSTDSSSLFSHSFTGVGPPMTYQDAWMTTADGYWWNTAAAAAAAAASDSGDVSAYNHLSTSSHMSWHEPGSTLHHNQQLQHHHYQHHHEAPWMMTGQPPMHHHHCHPRQYHHHHPHHYNRHYHRHHPHHPGHFSSLNSVDGGLRMEYGSVGGPSDAEQHHPATTTYLPMEHHWVNTRPSTTYTGYAPPLHRHHQHTPHGRSNDDFQFPDGSTSVVSLPSSSSLRHQHPHQQQHSQFLPIINGRNHAAARNGSSERTSGRIPREVLSSNNHTSSSSTSKQGSSQQNKKVTLFESKAALDVGRAAAGAAAATAQTSSRVHNA